MSCKHQPQAAEVWVDESSSWEEEKLRIDIKCALCGEKWKATESVAPIMHHALASKWWAELEQQNRCLHDKMVVEEGDAEHCGQSATVRFTIRFRCEQCGKKWPAEQVRVPVVHLLNHSQFARHLSLVRTSIHNTYGGWVGELLEVVARIVRMNRAHPRKGKIWERVETVYNALRASASLGDKEAKKVVEARRDRFLLGRGGSPF